MKNHKNQLINQSKDFSQPLQTYYHNAKILDFRSFPNVNNKIALFCCHASNTLPEGYSWSENDKVNFSGKHWAWDIEALGAAVYLASGLQCLVAHSLYSRILVDVNREMTDEDAFLKNGDGKIVELNQNLTQEEKEYRTKIYHRAYYDAIYEVLDKISPNIVLSIHSFTPVKDGERRTLEVGIECLDNTELSQALCDGFRKRGYRTEINEPYSGKLGHALHELLESNHGKDRDGVMLEFRNDILTDTKRAPKLKQDAYEVIREVCRHRF